MARINSKIYHVSKSGSDSNLGMENAPFLTIQRAADVAMAGDTVIVHTGVYREYVNPQRGGINDDCRIVFKAAEGEKVIIKGSEVVGRWNKFDGDIWTAEVPNVIFGNFNPFAVEIEGDWLVEPQEYKVHYGAVYLNGIALYEARNESELKNPPLRVKSELATWGNRTEAIMKPEESLYVWYAKVYNEKTVLYANFGKEDPNTSVVEINVRPCCFYPSQSGVNYITLSGFEIAQAATMWAPPTAEQIGMVGPNWSKGWIIEKNILHDSKCSAISLGKDASTGNNDYTYTKKKPDYLYQMEAVFKGLNKGWNKEMVGSHIVRNNTIYNCGQTGIVGHMGCIYSKVYDNDISYISTRHEFWGHEIAGIKFHAAIDVQIIHNHIHHCSLGTWLDWQAQGTRVSKNIYDHNSRDLMVEVTHGPYLVDNNIFASDYNFDNAAEGGAYVQNLCCGLTNQYPVLDRPTPYHFAHSTQVMGVIWTAGMDDRWYQNIFVGGDEDKYYGTSCYDGASCTIEEYLQRQDKYKNDYLEGYRESIQPVYIHRNVYMKGAEAFIHEDDAKMMPDYNPNVLVEETDDGVTLNITIPEEMHRGDNVVISSGLLGSPRITEACYENPDGSGVIIDGDILGNKLSGNPIAGPLQNLKNGENLIDLGCFGVK
ncbi:MAG: right-handed parallel beta-helix repeat-containing protein [Clostridium sp.]|nr:right-handed parallel beta-helix repeat-containing protein [Clostridium sp.]